MLPLPSSRPRAVAATATMAALLLALSFPPTASAAMTDPKSEHATLADVVSFVQTEVPADFEYGSGFTDDMTEEEMISKAKQLWDAAIAFEWERCGRAEDRGAGGCTYLVCKKANGGEVAKSGNARRTALEAAVERALVGANGGQAPEGVAEKAAAIASTFQSVYNVGDDWYCAKGMMAASVAAMLSCAEEDGGDGSDCTVTPLVMGTKMTPGMVDRMNMALDETYGEGEGSGEFPIVDVTLCSGAVSASDREALANMTAAGENQDLDLSGLDIAVRFKEYVTSSSEPTGDSAAKGVFEDAFWSKKNGDDSGGAKNSKRGDFWEVLFKEALGAGLCDAVYEERMTWSLFDLGLPPGEGEVVGDVTLALTLDKSSTPTSVDRKCVAALVGALSAWSDVCSVDIQPEYTVNNHIAQWLIQSGIEEQRPWFDVGLDGAGQVVAVSDTGIDTNNCFYWDRVNDAPTSNRNDNHRKVVQYVPFVDDVDQSRGHGSHVSATVAGRRAVDGINESTGPADGTARGAKIAFIDIGGPTGALSIPSTSFLLSTGRTGFAGLRNPASIHSGSWGSPGVNFYNAQAAAFDNFMSNNDDLLVNMAAGNSGRTDEPRTIGAPATFKNGIAVGSSHSFGSDLARGQLGPAYLSDFSSRGPAFDRLNGSGRMKPDVVAPGHNLVSAGALPSVTGECDTEGIPSPGRAAAGLLSIAGTSMATPAVSGTAALIRQYFVEGWYPGGTKGSGDSLSPSGALVKAVILNGAQTNMIGVDNGVRVTPVVPYDNNIGFGRVNLLYALHVEGKSEVQARVWDRQIIVDQDKDEFVVKIDRSNGCTFADLSATLVWVEPASVAGCSQCVLNDLDLHLTKVGGDGTIFYPNGLSRRDTMNIAERVVLSNVRDGDSYALHVTATNLDRRSQQYALVATGCFGGVASVLDASDNVFTAPPAGGSSSLVVGWSAFVISLSLVLFHWH